MMGGQFMMAAYTPAAGGKRETAAWDDGNDARGLAAKIVDKCNHASEFYVEARLQTGADLDYLISALEKIKPILPSGPPVARPWVVHVVIPAPVFIAACVGVTILIGFGLACLLRV